MSPFTSHVGFMVRRRGVTQQPHWTGLSWIVGNKPSEGKRKPV